jgi:hypothetical protein
MKYSLRSLMTFYLGVNLLGAAALIGLLAIGAAILSVVFIFEWWNSHPLKAVASFAFMAGTSCVMFLVARLGCRDAWKCFASIAEEPPSWGKPPPLPTSPAPGPNPPKP